MVTKRNGDTMTFTWDYPADAINKVAFFKIGYIVPGQTMMIYLFNNINKDTRKLSALVSFATVGIYKFRLIAVGLDGQESAPAEAEMQFVADAIAPPPTPTNFQIA